MVHKSCPDCEQQVPVACKACYCGYNFFEKRTIVDKTNTKEEAETVTPSSRISSDNIIGGSLKSRRTSRTKREKPHYYSASEYETHIRKLSRTSVSSEKSTLGVELPSSPRKRGRGRPPKHGNKVRRTLKKQVDKPEPDKEEDRDEDAYVNIPPDKAFVYGVVLADINRKIQGQWPGPSSDNLNGTKHVSSPTKRNRRSSDLTRS